MKKLFLPGYWLGFIFLALFASAATSAEEALELETTRIKANQELPQILYIVPWREFEASTGKRFKLQLHDFFGDLYEPQLPANLSAGKSVTSKLDYDPSSP